MLYVPVSVSESWFHWMALYCKRKQIFSSSTDFGSQCLSQQKTKTIYEPKLRKRANTKLFTAILVQESIIYCVNHLYTKIFIVNFSALMINHAVFLFLENIQYKNFPLCQNISSFVNRFTQYNFTSARSVTAFAFEKFTQRESKQMADA